MNQGTIAGLLFACSFGVATLGTDLASAQHRRVDAWLADAQARIDVRHSRAYIDALTVDSTVNVPYSVVTDAASFFSWDNEKRSAANGKAYLYEWSYYNGVVFEGLQYVYEATCDRTYQGYVQEYLDAMITDGALNETAGYVTHHGLDCYKTASTLLNFVDFRRDDHENSDYYRVASTLYSDLVSTNSVYTEASIGGNYWHSWINGASPLYKVWLDGLYMAQPFLAEYAHHTRDVAQLDAIASRFTWIAANMVSATTGLYYHAANSSTDYCDFHWLRAIGWYAMAQADVLVYLHGPQRRFVQANFRTFVDAMLAYQDPTTGMWSNLVDRPVTETNRLETSGTAMLAYSILKAIRTGRLTDTNGRYRTAALKAFSGIVENKLIDGRLTDIYFKASANGTNNYEVAANYYTDEGKGVGPFIMAYSEVLQATRSRHSHAGRRHWRHDVQAPRCASYQ
jgi:unsaturated rhamnogalacturonyl hydrolase